MRFRFFSALLLSALLLPAAGIEPVRAADAPVGIARLTVPGDTASRGTAANRLNVVVWYPAAAGTPVQPIVVGPPQTPLFAEGEAAVDPPLAVTAARYPLVVVSHGTGGTSMDVSWLCAGLAAAGYIVASLDHPGNNALEAPTVAGQTLWWMRANDLSRVIDGVLASARFGPHIDPARIGAAGFSLGGHTVLTIAGARSDPTLLDAYCARKPATPVCTGEATPDQPDVIARSKALAASDPGYRAAAAANADSHRDPRVKAVFSIAPALGPAIVPASLAEIAIPVELVAGIGDPILPVIDNAIPDALAIPDARLVLLPRTVEHYTFLTDCAPAGRVRLAPICRDWGPARVAVHRETLALARTFFSRTLAVP
ncbi:MAG: hypothetical protein WCE44_00405 [Candidatus Velthaea sp.]